MFILLRDIIIGELEIPDNVTLTVNSDLNGDSPQFTLTCISTGGPATTVTWTRNSTTVNEGNTSVLDDTGAAQYNHTLTVTGRKPGLYICAVENNVSSNSTTYTVKGVLLDYMHTPLNSVQVCFLLSVLRHTQRIAAWVMSHVIYTPLAGPGRAS